VAPGEGIRSTYWTGGYASWSGTSFAAPFVSAAAVLSLSIHPKIRAEALVNLLGTTAAPLGSLNPSYAGQIGKGIIDIEAVVRNHRH